MSLNKAIITPAEADVILATETDWLALTDPVKEAHIAKASVYMQTRFTCSEIDWSDDTTFTTEIQEACAYFALASSNGNLYPDPKATPDEKGNVIEETDKVGSLQSTVKYSETMNVTTSYDLLNYPNSLMGVDCFASSGGGSKKAIRV